GRGPCGTRIPRARPAREAGSAKSLIVGSREWYPAVRQRLNARHRQVPLPTHHAVLLSHREVDPLQHRPRRVAHLHVPGAGPIGGYSILAPGAPGRATYGQPDVAPLGIAPEPDRVEPARAGRAADPCPDHP